ncbi:MAG: RNA polymerase sigma factor [Gemmataceae bacterium]
MADSATEPDDELVRRCLNGDPSAMRDLVNRFEGVVYGLSVRLLSHRHDAEDVMQDVFIRVFRSLKSWDPSRTLKPWIIKITVNQCRTWITRRMSRPRPTLLVDDIPERSNDEGDGRELADAVQRAVNELRDEHKAVFVLYHEHGQNYEEIADVVGRPVGTVKTWLHRARATVLEKLKQAGIVHETHEVG